VSLCDIDQALDRQAARCQPCCDAYFTFCCCESLCGATDLGNEAHLVVPEHRTLADPHDAPTVHG
jgi:hypothetical protein